MKGLSFCGFGLGLRSERLFRNVNAVSDHYRWIDNELRQRCDLRHQRLSPEQAYKRNRHLASLPSPKSGSQFASKAPPTKVSQKAGKGNLGPSKRGKGPIVITNLETTYHPIRKCHLYLKEKCHYSSFLAFFRL